MMNTAFSTKTPLPAVFSPCKVDVSSIPMRIEAAMVRQLRGPSFAPEQPDGESASGGCRLVENTADADLLRQGSVDNPALYGARSQGGRHTDRELRS
jgi:hypothetical protein